MIEGWLALLIMFYSGHFVEYALDRPDVQPAWKRFTEHEFVKRMGDGTLSEERFKSYLVQDYLYLVGCLR